MLTPSSMGGLLARIRSIVGRSRAERELDEEIRFHLEMEAEANLRRGMPPEQARREARVAFGGLEGFREACRDARGTRVAEETIRDLRLGCRQIRRAPRFALAVVVALALGSGTAGAVLAVVDPMLLRPLAFAESGRLVHLGERNPALGIEDFSVSPANFADWRAQTRSFQHLAAFRERSYALSGGEPERVTGAGVSEDFFPALGAAVQRGRLPGASDFRPGAPRAVVLSHALWRRRYRADARIVGGTVRVDGLDYLVLGVLPAEFRFPGVPAELWTTGAWAAAEGDSRAERTLRVVGRLRHGVSRTAAEAEVARVARTLAERHPDAQAGWSVRMVPLRERVTEAFRPALRLLVAGAAALGAAALGNVMVLFATRNTGRRREFAARRMLGASAARIARQLLAEGAALGALGGLAGVLLCAGLVRVVVALAPDDAPRLAAVRADPLVLAMVFAAAVAAAGGAALVSAAAGRAPVGGRGAPGPRRAVPFLIAAETAIAVLLLVTAGLLLRSHHALRAVDPGFRATHVVTGFLRLPHAGYPDAGARLALFHDVLTRAAGIPGAVAVGATSALPLGHHSVVFVRRRGHSTPASLPVYTAVSPGYFAALQIPLLAGRPLRESDAQGAPAVALINQAMAREHFPRGDALGARLHLAGARDTEGVEIVGIVGDARQRTLREPAAPQLYLPLRQSAAEAVTLVLRTDRDPAAAADALRAALRQADPALPLAYLRPMTAVVEEQLALGRLGLRLLAAFAGAAVFLALAGVYAMIAYAVSQRTAELGIRLALGAAPWRLAREALRQACLPIAAGVAAGALGTLAASRIVQPLLFQVSAAEPVTFACAALAVGAAALAAGFIPAYRVARRAPMRALRHE